jgi:hypothetical protein
MQKHLGAIITAAVTVAVNLAVFVYGYGKLNAKHEDAMKELEVIRIETKGGDTQKLLVELHDRRIGLLEAKTERQGESLAEIRSDIRLIAEWVREQKEHRP